MAVDDEKMRLEVSSEMAENTLIERAADGGRPFGNSSLISEINM